MLDCPSQWCKDSIRATIFVEFEEYVYLPNSFTPNGDNLNDNLKPILLNISVENFSSEIFDRWGELIFFTQSTDGAWDGKLNGQLLSDDTFVWRIRYLSEIDGDIRIIYGHVTLFSKG